jgi:thiamine pyrophosphate-dependent acetolactate synthase large subunit-like protein
MLVSEAVAATLAELADLGTHTVFGVVGSGNFHVTNALVARGATFVATRHECGAACAADAWARGTGRVGILTVHQGPGLTNALTGIAEAAKSRTPLLVLAPDVASAAVRSNFRVDVAAIATSVGAVPDRLHSPGTAAADTARAYQTARRERRTVVLAMPLDVQGAHCDPPVVSPLPPLDPPAPAPEAAARLTEALTSAARPVFVAGRGARVAGARADLERLADASGALLATSGADLIIGWGCSLNMWTMRHGKLIGPGSRVAQVDDDTAAIGAHRPADIGVLGDVAQTARAVLAGLAGRVMPGYRSDVLRSRIAREIRWRDVPYADEGTPRSGGQDSDGGRIDPRTLTIALDDLLPAERVVAIDSGNFMGYPSMFLSVPDEGGFCFTQAYQSIGLGLASAIGAALAQPGRLPVAALGDGGALMGVSELETVVRLGLPMVIVVYDDEAYGAEVHHFGPDGFALDTVRFPPADIAAIGRGFGCDGVTVRGPDDLGPVRDWLAGPRDRPLVIDAKVASAHGAWWLEEAFRGH